MALSFAFGMGLKERIGELERCDNSSMTIRELTIVKLAELFNREQININSIGGPNRFTDAAKLTAVVLRVLLPLTSELAYGREEVLARATFNLYAYRQTNEDPSLPEEVFSVLPAPAYIITQDDEEIVGEALAAFMVAYRYVYPEEANPSHITNVFRKKLPFQDLIFAIISKDTLPAIMNAMQDGTFLGHRLPSDFYNSIDCFVWSDVQPPLPAEYDPKLQTIRTGLSALLMFAAIDPTFIALPSWVIAAAIAKLLVEMASSLKAANDVGNRLNQLFNQEPSYIGRVADALVYHYWEFFHRIDYRPRFRDYIIRNKVPVNSVIPPSINAFTIKPVILPRTDADLAALETFLMNRTLSRIPEVRVKRRLFSDMQQSGCHDGEPAVWDTDLVWTAFELVRQSGRHNMIMEFRGALIDAASVLAVVYAQPALAVALVSIVDHDGLLAVISRYINLTTEHRERLRASVIGLLRDHEALSNRWVGTGNSIQKDIVQEAYRYCMAAGKTSFDADPYRTAARADLGLVVAGIQWLAAGNRAGANPFLPQKPLAT